MKRSRLLAIVLSVIVSSVAAQTFVPDGKNSAVTFKIKNFGSNVEGSFADLKGTIRFDENSLTATQIDVSIDANSIDTGIGMRDNHLRKKDYFDVKNYPRIRFVSSKVAATEKPSTYSLTGTLTIKNTSRQISFPFTYSVVNGNPVFKGQFQIDRRDFDVGGGSLSMSDNLIVLLSVATKKQP